MSLSEYWQSVNIVRLSRRITNLEERMATAQEHINELAQTIDAATNQIGSTVSAVAEELADLKDQINRGQPEPDFGVLDTSVSKLNDAASQLAGLPGDAVPQVPADSGTSSTPDDGSHT